MKTTRRTALLLLGSSALTGCSAASVVARNESDPFEGGIGGTGIVGTLNGFSSLLINGLQVELDRSTRVKTAFGRASTDLLKTGQVLTVAATRRRDATTAQNVTIDYALVGVLRQAGRLTSVNGVPLIAPQDAIGHGAVGRRVAVSGVWTPNGVRPSRIDPAPHDLDLIAGTMDGRTIGGTPLSGSSPFPPNGSYAVALGRAAHGGFVVEGFRRGRFEATEQLRQLSVEGYLEPTRFAPGFRVAGLGHSFAPNTSLASIGPRRTLFFGRYDGLFEARRGYLVADQFSARRDQLRDGLGAEFPGQIKRL